ncbi:MAG: hypothetical protein RL136_795 [Planctomycetota bacterium]|jgi:hypothetical protein
MRTYALLASSLPALVASAAYAQNPPMGGPMQMYSITIDTNMQSVMAMPMGTFSTVNLVDYGATYSGAASVLNGQAFNSQWGWFSGGFADLGDNSVWIELVSATPGLNVYRGGGMGMPPTFVPIFGTDGSSNRIQWNGMMLHNYYAGIMDGYYEHTYRVYVGDAMGNDLGWSAATVTWSFSVPAPGAVAVLGLSGLVGSRRRRTR